MKIAMFFAITLISLSTFSQVERFDLIPTNEVEREERLKFKEEKNSYFKWESINERNFLDLDKWKQHIALADKEPRWRRNLAERNLRELIGRVIDCVGDCRLFKSLGFNKLRYRSAIREGDEVINFDDSYLWIFMIDGTLVRISPNSSVSFKEINIGEDANFLHARVNYGNVLWQNRLPHNYKPRESKETDALFLPLSMYEANPAFKKLNYKEEDLYAFLVENNEGLKKYKKLNQLIKENNEKIYKKPTYNYLVFPNGNLFGKNIILEAVALNTNETYIKKRVPTWQGMNVEKEIDSFLKLTFRGFNNVEKMDIGDDQWISIDPKGRSANSFIPPKSLGVSEFLTSNIPSILIAREIFYQQYSSFAHNETSKDRLATINGYRLWTSMENGELKKRVDFLNEYTRRVETSNLLTAEQFKKKLLERGESVDDSEYSIRFVNRAISYYLISKDSDKVISDSNNEVLNSTQKSFWKRINAVRK
ncbi:MAG: hypothetical protein GY909_03750 [Oligoflexia bacterium]|nr:hypothetical protein [Oligoflexia bacterium]